MIRSYITLALRTFQRHPLYVTVNTIGLTVGLGCCILVALFLQYELQFDAHHENADRIYRIVSDFADDEFSHIRFPNYYRSTAAEQRTLVQRLPEAIPAVEQAANFMILNEPRYVTTPDGAEFTSDRQLVTPSGEALMDVFTFERVAGAPLQEALRQPNSAVLTTSTAQRYFGDADPIGQTLTIGSTPVTVRAVIAEPPSNSRLTFDLALQLKRIPWWAAFTYVRLSEGADVDAVTEQISAVMDEVMPDRLEDDDLVGEYLQALPNIHLAERKLYDRTPHRDPAYLWAFGIIGILILGITIINYANLALALYAGRNAEIGVRKAVGGHPWQIAQQFLAESSLLALLCVLPAVLLVRALLPAFNALMDIGIPLSDVTRPTILLSAAGLALLSGGIAGGYPSFVLSRKKTVQLFDRTLTSPRSKRSWSLRGGLIALQFVVLIGMGSLTWIVYNQLDFMQNSDLGYPTDVVVSLDPLRADSSQYQALKRRLGASPNVAAVGVGAFPRTRINRGPFTVTDHPREYTGGDYESTDLGWFDVMGIDPPALDDIRAMGPSAPEKVFVNQAFVQTVEVDSLLGRGLINNPSDPDPQPPEIVGVLPNLVTNSMQYDISPTHYHVEARPSFVYTPLVRLVDGRLSAGLDDIDAVTGDIFPDQVLTVSFLSDRVARLYEQERQFVTLGAVLAGIAILLAALGLGSLVAYLTRQRRKEIGIRKALGGSTWSLVRLLNAEYVRIVGAAFVVGVPLAWLSASAWLEQFAYQTDISPLVFAGTGVGALAVAILAVSTQAVRAARIDPAQVLRSE